MNRWNRSFSLLALGVPGLVGSLTALPLRGAERWSPTLVLGAMIMWGLAIFLAGLMSLFGTRRFLRSAASAKGHVSDIYEATPAGASDYLFPGRIVTVQFWTEQEESIAFRSPTLQGNPETAAGLVPVLYDPNRPAEAKIRSFEGLWFTSGLVMVMGAGWSLLFTEGRAGKPLSFMRGMNHRSLFGAWAGAYFHIASREKEEKYNE